MTGRGRTRRCWTAVAGLPQLSRASLRDAHRRLSTCRHCAMFAPQPHRWTARTFLTPAAAMPPRRSNAAAKRAAEDLTDEADDAKRHKADALMTAYRAAASSSSSSAGVATVAAAAAAAAAAPSQRSDSALAAAAAAVPLPDTPSCSVCMEPFPASECKEEGGAGRVPRSLPCPKLHTYCSDCLEGMLHHEDDGADDERSERQCAHSRNHIADAAVN